MTKEIRSTNVENSQLCFRRFRHSDFLIPSDFVIRHSDLRIAVCSIKRSVSGLVRTAVGGSVHGKRVWRSYGRRNYDETYGRLGHVLSILPAAIVQGKKFGGSARIFVCNLLAAK